MSLQRWNRILGAHGIELRTIVLHLDALRCCARLLEIHAALAQVPEQVVGLVALQSDCCFLRANVAFDSLIDDVQGEVR